MQLEGRFGSPKYFNYVSYFVLRLRGDAFKNDQTGRALKCRVQVLNTFLHELQFRHRTHVLSAIADGKRSI